MKRGERIARRYARALFGLGSEPAALLRELSDLVELTEGDASLRRVLFTPIHPKSERRAVVHEICSRLGLAPELGAFSRMLVDENRTALLLQIRDILHALVEHAAGRVEAQVVSARALDDAQAEQIRQALGRRVKAQVKLKLSVDPELIGGVVTRVGGLLLDGSVRTRLASLGGSLEKGSV